MRDIILKTSCHISIRVRNSLSIFKLHFYTTLGTLKKPENMRKETIKMKTREAVRWRNGMKRGSRVSVINSKPGNVGADRLPSIPHSRTRYSSVIKKCQTLTEASKLAFREASCAFCRSFTTQQRNEVSKIYTLLVQL
jgi:hypothetical protein